ncbi:phosphogluconate dehydratase [Noviherbaspirillum sedimenti]|uniref:Phosphogluconate dehydratase n=1 Tax=Noviherbaspirillum sedimenti TaxID=2320865 RepID=A0A3A3G1B4_9BURK|nr:phosphogluconate dehydratase [Noviherbaspirillum sedimenti]RJG01704.1 phosphogluconate dehydratase [Noviherbaspirillum sedimenti]
MSIHATVAAVTEKIAVRSRAYRRAYLHRLDTARHQGVQRGTLSCTNLAHGFAAFPANDKLQLKQMKSPSVAIVSAYNDMLSAHQPFERFPPLIRDAVRAAGGVAQFAGGTPAMCDGITQGQAGMELSLFSRDTIAMATAVALSHNMFDAVVYLGVCDKIVPGLLIGALHFGHLPAVFIPAGPMTSGLSNPEKSRIRQLYAQGKIGRVELLEAEAQSYHDPGTCTFYGTANSNQMLMDVMGLHLPGAAFVTPNTPLRDALTQASARRAVEISTQGAEYTPVGHVVDEKAIVNAIVALLATGGSTNHTLHLVAIARAAGIVIDWNDFAALSTVVPLLARIYPNGEADINHFHAAGGTPFIIRELLDAGILHEDVTTVLGRGLRAHCTEPFLGNEGVVWQSAPAASGSLEVLRPAAAPFSPEGGLRLLTGNLGRAVVKVSAVKPQHRVVEAPALVFDSQDAFMQAFEAGRLQRDFIAVLRFQGPRANGMPELHALTPALGSLQDAGFHVGLVTDGRMSGASGKVPAAIHVTPEVLGGGPLGRVQDGDLIRLDAEAGMLQALVPAAQWDARAPVVADLSPNEVGMGRELFAMFRRTVGMAEEGAATFGLPPLLAGDYEHSSLGTGGQPFNDEDTQVNERTSS